MSCQRDLSRRRSSAFTLVEILVVVGVIALLAAILLPVFLSAKARALSASCAGNLKQIGLALNLYANDHNTRYPHYPGEPGIPGLYCPWADRLSAYIPNESTFNCPAITGGKYVRGCHDPAVVERDALGFIVTYKGNYDLNLFSYNYTRGVAESRFRHPSTTISVLDGGGEFISSRTRDMSTSEGQASAGVDKQRHRGGNNVLFMDGHVKWMRESDLRDPMLWIAGNALPSL